VLQLSFCFCSDGHGICTDCQCLEKNSDGKFLPQNNHNNHILPQNTRDCSLNFRDSSLNFDETVCRCCQNQEKFSEPSQKNTVKNLETSSRCLQIDVSLVSANCVLNEKEQNPSDEIGTLISWNTVVFLTQQMPEVSDFTASVFDTLSTCRLSVRLHLLKSVLMI